VFPTTSFSPSRTRGTSATLSRRVMSGAAGRMDVQPAHHGTPSTRIRLITNRRSLLSTSSTRRAMASPCGSVSTSCGARRGYSVSPSYPCLSDLGSSFPPTAVPVCRAEFVASRRAASLLGQAPLVVAWLSEPSISDKYQHLPLVFTDEVYQNFTCVCHIARA